MYYKKKLDSAEYYLRYAEKIQGSNPPAFDKYSLYRNWGELYEHKKSYDSAKKYYIQSLVLAEKMKSPDTRQTVYWLLHKLADSMRDKETSYLYLDKYAKLYDSLSKIKKTESEFPIQQYINEKQAEYKNREDRAYYIIALIIIVGTLILLLFIKFFKRKEKSLEERLQKKRETIKEKEQETLGLKVKVNEGFEEVVRLAKTNSPEFVTRFKEIYPEFCEALLKIYPDINQDTLKFCALLKLNFSTKIISEYTYVTIRAVQIRKTRLRKKLNIPSDEDIYIWMDNLK